MCDNPFPDFSTEGNPPCAADSTTADYGTPGNGEMDQWYIDPPLALLGSSDLIYGPGFTERVSYYSSGIDYNPPYIEGCGYFQPPLKHDGSYLAPPATSYAYPPVTETNIKSTTPAQPAATKEQPERLEARSAQSAPSAVRSYCKVCGDTASGNHFGVLSCEACKSFFRRSIRANARYACRWTRNCVVDRFTRNRCKYCRLEKCVLLGMKKEAVQEDRLILGYSLMSKMAASQAQVHLPPQFHTSIHRVLSQTAHDFQVKTCLARWDEGISSDHVDSTSGRSTLKNPSNMLNTVEDPVALCNRFPITMATLLNVIIEPKSKDLRAMTHSVGIKDVVETLQLCFTKVIHWSAQIPSFTHLGLDDQVRLLKTSWCEQCVLLFALDNTVVPKTAFVLEGYLCERDQVEDPMVTEIVDKIIGDVTYWLNYLHVDDAELACLRALLLFNPGARCLSPTAMRAVELYQEQILAGLGAHITKIHGVASTRLAKLVLQLGTIKAISHEMLQGMVVHQKQGTVSMGDTFTELMQFN